VAVCRRAATEIQKPEAKKFVSGFLFVSKIAQPFMAGNNATQISKSRQGRQKVVAVCKDFFRP
jgi:hypothetical protein